MSEHAAFAAVALLEEPLGIEAWSGKLLTAIPLAAFVGCLAVWVVGVRRDEAA